jgi:hypothetical protein
MRAGWGIVMAVALLLGAVAGAEGAMLSAREVRAELVGVELIGIVEGVGESWRECIEPGQRTFYLRPGLPADGPLDEGRLEVADDGRLCFSYRSSDFSRRACYWAARTGANYRFVSADGGHYVFATTSVRRGVRSCDRADAPLS